MQIDDVRRAIEEAKEHNAAVDLKNLYEQQRITYERSVNDAVRKLLRKHYKRRKSVRKDKEDFLQEGWSFLFGLEGQDVLLRAEVALKPLKYVRSAVYRHLFRWAESWYETGRYKHKRKEHQVKDRFWPLRPDLKGQSTSVETLLWELQLDGDAGRFVEGMLLEFSDYKMRSENHWTKAELAAIRSSVTSLLLRQYPAEVAAIINTTNRTLFRRMDQLFQSCFAEDRQCSVLFTVDDQCWLWGTLCEPVSGVLNRPVAAGPRLALGVEEVLPAISPYLPNDHRPALVPPAGRFWMYDIVP